MSIISKDIQKAIQLLETEELVAIPTETVYGLAGNIFSEKAIKKIFETKKRPLFNPLIVHIPNKEYLPKIVSYIPKKAKLLATHFWPGSMTLVLPKHKSIPNIITAGKNTVAVRIPNHPVTLKLLNELSFPLAAPSANPFNSISPTKPEHVENYFKNNINMVLDGGLCKSGIESTIVGFEFEEPIIYRLGALSLEEIEAVVGKVTLKNNKENNPNAPGMLAKHYAPKTTIVLVDDVKNEIKKHTNKKTGVLVFSQTTATNTVKEIILSKDRNFKEAASNLYAAMHTLDKLNLDIIIAERFPNIDLGKSINDRLQRATS